MLPVLCDVHDDSVRNWWKPAGGHKGGRKQKLSAAHLTDLSETVDMLAGQVALTSVNFQNIFEKVHQRRQSTTVAAWQS
eukprot:1802734-Amphidinium_carterae.1